MNYPFKENLNKFDDTRVSNMPFDAKNKSKKDPKDVNDGSYYLMCTPSTLMSLFPPTNPKNVWWN